MLRKVMYAFLTCIKQNLYVYAHIGYNIYIHVCSL